MRLFTTLLLHFVPTSAYTITPLLSHLSPSTEIFYRNSTTWNETVQRWNIYGEPTFFASIKPDGVDDLRDIVRFASKHDIPFLASAGGHGFSTHYQTLQDGLQIDLGNFDRVDVDPVRNTMTIGGGVAFNDVMDPLFEAGREIQTGSCSCVGMVGATLGAGVGRYQGVHGLIIDSVRSFKLMTARGELIEVSRHREPELFWGMRGAGFNFGIVVEATYDIHELTNGGNVLVADFKFPPSVNGSYFELLEAFNDTLPGGLSLFTSVTSDETYGSFILLNAVYAGPREEGLAYIKPFLDLPNYTRNVRQVPWNKHVTSSAFGLDSAWCIEGGAHYMWTVGVKKFDAATHIAFFNRMMDFLSQYPGASSSGYWIEYFPTGKVMSVPDRETAYPHRDISAHIMLVMGYEDENLTDPVNEFGEAGVEFFNSASGYDDDGLHVYVSYARGTEGLNAMYAKRKLDRLLKLKRKWDPKGLFVFNNPLPVPSF